MGRGAHHSTAAPDRTRALHEGAGETATAASAEADEARRESLGRNIVSNWLASAVASQVPGGGMMKDVTREAVKGTLLSAAQGVDALKSVGEAVGRGLDLDGQRSIPAGIPVEGAGDKCC